MQFLLPPSLYIVSQPTLLAEAMGFLSLAQYPALYPPLHHLTTGLSCLSVCLSIGPHCPQLEGTMVYPSAEHTPVLQARRWPASDPAQGKDPPRWLHHHLPLLGV